MIDGKKLITIFMIDHKMIDYKNSKKDFKVQEYIS